MADHGNYPEGSNTAFPLTPGVGPLSGVKPNNLDQDPTLGSNVGLSLESSYTPQMQWGRHSIPIRFGST
jgi:hypothetical protein